MGILNDKRRFVLEAEIMRERYPEATLCVSGDKVSYECMVQAEGSAFPFRFVYPDDYPHTPPKIVPLFKMPKQPPHMISGGLCWVYSGETRSRNRWDPSRDTMALAVGAAHRWVLAYLAWFTTGLWPVPDARS
jgi:hypothetical protein